MCLPVDTLPGPAISPFDRHELWLFLWAAQLTSQLCVSAIGEVSESRSVVSDSVTYGLEPARLLCPWGSLGKNTAVGSCSLFLGVLPIQGLNPGLLPCRRILYHLSHQGSPNWRRLILKKKIKEAVVAVGT